MASINTRAIRVRLSPDDRLLSTAGAERVAEAAFLLELIAFGEARARAAWPRASTELLRSGTAVAAKVRAFEGYFRPRGVLGILDSTFREFTGNTFSEVWAEVTLCATDRPVHGLATQG